MIEKWFSCIELPIDWEQFHRLPRNAAYKYEYFNDKSYLTPRPKFYHALLPLRTCDRTTEVDAQDKVTIRPLLDDDWRQLPLAFAAAFHAVQPFANLDDDACQAAAEDCLKHTREGGDGPLIHPACFVAYRSDGGGLLGAVLVTLMPNVDLTDFHSLRWQEDPPPDAIDRRAGRPHLTWIFVTPFHARFGVGTALLENAVDELHAMGFKELASTFLLGNDSSLLWHWRTGFQLVAYPGSMRRIRESIQAT